MDLIVDALYYINKRWYLCSSLRFLPHRSLPFISHDPFLSANFADGKVVLNGQLPPAVMLPSRVALKVGFLDRWMSCFAATAAAWRTLDCG
jgi:hypothetical protein